MPDHEPSEDSLPRLTLPERVGIVAFCLAIFLFVEGPIWRHPWSPDASILWSYAPIPFLVLAVFAARRRVRAASVFLETILLFLVKFGITATILVTLWTLGPPAPDRRPKVTFEPRSTPVPEKPLTVDVIVKLAVGPGGFHPDRLEIPKGGGLLVSSGDGSLHTIHAVDESGKTLFNLPLLANGHARGVVLNGAPGRVTLRCEVHPQEKGEIVVGTGK